MSKVQKRLGKRRGMNRAVHVDEEKRNRIKKSPLRESRRTVFEVG